MCRCAYGYYQNETTGRCEACRVCEAGSGLVYSCQDKQNTVCEECPDGTYSDEANHVDPCLPCTVCEDTERQLRECTRWADAECEGERPTGPGPVPHYGRPPAGEGRPLGAGEGQAWLEWGPPSLRPDGGVAPHPSHQRPPLPLPSFERSVWKAILLLLPGHSCRIWLTAGTGQVADKQPGSGHCDHSSEPAS